MSTPEEQRCRRARRDVAASNRERGVGTHHGVAHPATEDKFLELYFALICAIAGLQLGQTKVFLRREAFDHIGAMRSDRFYGAATAIQKTFRRKVKLVHYCQMKAV